MFVAFILMAVKFWHHNVLSGNDRRLAGKIGDVIANRGRQSAADRPLQPGSEAPVLGAAPSMSFLLVSGIANWQPYSRRTSRSADPAGALFHALSALALIFLHPGAHLFVVLGEGIGRGMLSGKVSRAWAKAHHPPWYDEATRK